MRFQQPFLLCLNLPKLPTQALLAPSALVTVPAWQSPLWLRVLALRSAVSTDPGLSGHPRLQPHSAFLSGLQGTPLLSLLAGFLRYSS